MSKKKKIGLLGAKKDEWTAGDVRSPAYFQPKLQKH
jgi:hypothetical protein